MTGYADFEEFVVARRGALLRTAYLLTGDLPAPASPAGRTRRVGEVGPRPLDMTPAADERWPWAGPGEPR